MKDKLKLYESKIEGQIALILMKAGVTGPDIDACLDWAFGPNALYVPIYPDWIDRWRKLHPEHPVKRQESFVEWIFVVGFLYCAYVYQKMNTKQVHDLIAGKKFNVNPN